MDPTCIITYANQKGGVGKTTLCALFASYLVSKGHRVAVFDTDPQQSIAKKRASDMEVYSGCQVPYAVYSFSLNNEKSLISLIGNIRGSGHFDFVLFDSAGSLTDQALLALFANTDYLLTPFHYDYLSVPSTAVFIALIVKLRKSLGRQMKTRHYLIPNLDDPRVGISEEKALWDETEEKFSRHAVITPRIGKRATMERFSTMSEMDEQMIVVSPAFEIIYKDISALQTIQ